MFMTFRDLHPEDVRAAIKKQYGTIVAFTKAKDLPATSVHDVLRGGSSLRVEKEIESVIMAQRHSNRSTQAHCKNHNAQRQAK